MSTEVVNETQTAIDGTEFSALADHVLRALHVNPLAELNILFVDPEPMAELHMRWLKLPGPTDVMSFPMDELRPGTAESETGHSAVEEMLLLTTHGILHLLGYDHAEPQEKKEMFDLQRTLLLTFLAERGQ